MMSSPRGTGRRPAGIAVLVALLGAIAAGVLGLLTFGVQATVQPDGLPLAVAVADPQLEPVAGHVITQGGGKVDWQVTDPAGARQLLDDKKIYGYLTLAPGSVTGVTSGALNPPAAQVAEQVLRGAGDAVAQATHAPPFTLTTVHPTSPGAKVIPLASAALLWIGGLAANALLLIALRRSGRRPTVPARLTLIVVAAIAGPVLVYGLARLWAPDVAWNWSTIGYLALVSAAFAALQAAVLRLVGVAGIPLLGLLYLMAPAVAGQPPELLNPGYRALVWSWTPIRFATEPVRSLLFLNTRTADVTTGLIVFCAIAIAALVVVLWPGRRRIAEADRAANGAVAEQPTAIVPPAEGGQQMESTGSQLYFRTTDVVGVLRIGGLTQIRPGEDTELVVELGGQ